MKIKVFIILSWFFSMGACSSVETHPENCSRFDGDEESCINGGCFFQKEEVWCVKDDTCLIDSEHTGVCYYSPQNANNGNITSAYRDGGNLGIRIRSPGYLPVLENWKECDSASSSKVCECLEMDRQSLTVGSCE